MESTDKQSNKQMESSDRQIVSAVLPGTDLLVVDFGSQVCHLIASKMRNMGAIVSTVSHKITQKQIYDINPKGIILSGGPSSIYEKSAPLPNFDLEKLSIPILGICYGCQVIGSTFGGQVEPKSTSDTNGSRGEYGVQDLMIDSPLSPLFADIDLSSKVIMSHGDSIVKSPPNFSKLASTSDCEFAAISSNDKKIYGIQFHPEVTHTEIGTQIFKNFINICDIKQDSWNLATEIKKIVKDIRENVKEPIIMAVSGGVDSTVAATMIEHAVPDLLHCIFVNNGVLRMGEAEEVCEIYKKLFKNFEYVDASEKFLTGLSGVTDPEQKRKIIGKTFIEIFDDFSKKLRNYGVNVKYLGQGTIYPDRIESSQSSTNSQVIKSHHNVGGLPDNMMLTLVEPLKDFYKDEVRAIGRILGISNKLIDRQPFPGPGLAIRCLGEVTEPRLAALRKADKIFLEELQKDDKVWRECFQAFAVILPVKTVGVMGDCRTYDEVCALRVINSVNAMSGVVPELPWPLLFNACKRIVNEVKGINRVVFDLTGKPPGTIEWE